MRRKCMITLWIVNGDGSGYEQGDPFMVETDNPDDWKDLAQNMQWVLDGSSKKLSRVSVEERERDDKGRTVKHVEKTYYEW